MARGVGLLLLLVSAHVSVLRAQTLAFPESYDTTFTVACPAGVTAAVDSATLLLLLRADRDAQERMPTAEMAARAQFVMQALADSFRMPLPLAVPQPQAWERYESPFFDPYGTPPAFPAGRSQLTVFFSGTRGVDSVRLTRSTGITALDTALVGAAERAAAASAFDGISDVPVSLQVLLNERFGVYDRPIGRVAVTYVLLSKPAMPKRHVPPRYPREMRTAGREGRVELSYVVGATGRVVPRTVRVLRASNEACVGPAVDTVTQSVFAPARAGSCRVPTHVQQAVGFRLMGVP